MHFVSFWALAAHALSLMGVLPSTLALAMFTLGGSVYHNCFVNTSYKFALDILIHYVPVLVMFFVDREIVFWPIIVVYTLFFASNRWDFSAIVARYRGGGC